MDIKKGLQEEKCILVGIFVLVLFMLIVMIIPFIELPSPSESTKDIFLPPSQVYILGTNDMGQDIFSRLLYGLRTSVFTSLSVGIVATFTAGFLGALAALIGGLFDRFILKICDIFLALPEFIICLLIASYIRPNVMTLIIMISLLNWQGPLKVVRSQVLICSKDLSVYAARTFGANTFYILKNHIVPEISPLLLSIFIRNVRIAVFMEASFSYLGLVDPEMISFGRIMSNAMSFTYLEVWKWWLLPVGITLSLFLLSLTCVGYFIENRKRIYLEEDKS
ncbi:MAG: ABC transporter permease [Clostridia bacterium]|nr:ABC transporter permease [Clostridia bacterium]